MLERDAEIAAIDEAMESAANGDGRVVLVEGAAGIGKTRLLGEAVRRGRDAGFDVLSARASEMEQDLAWAVARDLFAPALTRCTPSRREELLAGPAAGAQPVLGHGRLPGDAGALSSLLNALYWLMVNLASESPLLVVVDDLHWADQDSFRALGYLAARVEDLPVLVLGAARPNEPGGTRVDPLFDSASLVVRPSALSEEACTRLLAERIGTTPEAALTSACRSATAGNPFLLNELVGELVREGLPPTSETARTIRDVRPEAVRRAVLRRLERMGDSAVRLAASVAVFGGGVRLQQAAAAAGLDAADALDTADRLTAAQVLAAGEPLEFIHPLVRSVVYGDIAELRRRALHRRVADVLEASGASPQEVAIHLLAAPRDADPEAVDRLVRAGAGAIEQGAFDAAARYLHRALEEPCAPGRRASILLDLGRAEVRSSGGPGAAALFREAFAVEDDPIGRAEIALEHARTVRMNSSFTVGAELLKLSAQELEPGTDLAWEVEAELLNLGFLDFATFPVALERMQELRARLDPEAIEAPGLLADLAIMQASAAQPREIPVGLARRALRLLSEQPRTDVSAIVYATNALAFADELDEAREGWDGLLADPEWRESPLAVGFASVFRSMVFCRAGRLAEAESDARFAHGVYVEFARTHPDAVIDHELPVPETHAHLIDALIERGELDEAERLAQPGGEPGSMPGLWVYNRYLFSRGSLRVARREFDRALADLRECGRRQEAWASVNPAVLPWRSSAALALLGLGEREEAARLAGEELERARAFGAPRAIAISLRAAALAARGDEAVEMLREAVAVLEGSPARLEFARAHFELGRALRQGSRRVDAREHLRLALDGASRCGGRVLAEAARAELVAAGGKPRREVLRGREALTASEARVAAMASEGRSNKQIAQELFVSMRTVETHLTHAYQKLDITARADLPAALGA